MHFLSGSPIVPPQENPFFSKPQKFVDAVDDDEPVIFDLNDDPYDEAVNVTCSINNVRPVAELFFELRNPGETGSLELNTTGIWTEDPPSLNTDGTFNVNTILEYVPLVRKHFCSVGKFGQKIVLISSAIYPKNL